LGSSALDDFVDTSLSFSLRPTNLLGLHAYALRHPYEVVWRRERPRISSLFFLFWRFGVLAVQTQGAS